MNYLALCQRMNRESGTISGNAVPATVVGQTGRLLKVVDWVSQAWTDIQNTHDTWKWMRGEFSGSLLIGAARYTAASFNLNRWQYWITERDSLTIYDPAIGVADETALNKIEWQEWRRLYGRGTQTRQRPREYAISPAGELCFGPIPDKVYTANGEYQKSAQILAANTDIPECPSDFHIIIVWYALLYLDEHDEASIAKAQRRRQDVMRPLEGAQLPEITIDAEGTLA